MTRPVPPPGRKPWLPPLPETPAPVRDSIASLTNRMTISKGRVTAGQKIILYGTGGVGKTELCSLISKVGIEPLFIDVEDSSKFLDVARITPTNWDETRSILHSPETLKPFGAVVIDSLTKAEEFAAEWTKANIPHEKGHFVRRLEDYGFGKGYTHVMETFLNLLADLDAVARAGKHIICTAHVCTEQVPNPSGENYLQFQPRLQSPPKQGKIRERCKEWCDHLLYIAFDTFVEGGKATGSGTRTIYPSELPMHWAKSRTLSEAMGYPKDDHTVWQLLFD